MGVHLYVTALMGIEIKMSDYQIQETGPTNWCSHLEPSQSNAQFCPDCGSKRPEKLTRTYTVTLWEKLPKAFLDALAGTGVSLEDLKEHHDDLGELGWSDCKFDGNLTLIENGGRTWLGRSLGELGGYSADEIVEHDLNVFSADIKNHITKLGFDGEKTKFIMYSYWS